MRKLLILLLGAISLFSCSSNDDFEPETELYNYAPIVSVEFPEFLQLGEVNDIKVTYTNPSPCHKMFGYEYVPDNEFHYFGIVSTYDPKDPLCTDEEGSTEEYIWKFRANRNENYIFKFWTGIDDEGEAVFLTKEVLVQE